MYKNLKELVEDKDFLVALVETKTPDEFAALLNEKGVEFDGITKEEAFEAFHSQKDVEADSEEFFEDKLAEVSGGVALCVGAIIFTAGVSTWVGASAYGYYKCVYFFPARRCSAYYYWF